MSNINQYAAIKINNSEITGPKLLAMFQALAQQMELTGAEGNFAQFQFVSDPSILEEGDLVPELHLSIRTYHGPLLSKPTTFETEET